jgi:hypothetical protein
VTRDYPRLFGITATHADYTAIIRRGPSSWCHVGAWDTARKRYESGSWFRGKIFPQRCDLSPDGAWLSYTAFKGNNKQELGESYVAISRLPWLHALAAWSVGSAYSRGLHFVRDKTVWNVSNPQQGDLGPLRSKFGMYGTNPVQFAVERRRGWIESYDSPMRDPNDMWDERREARMQKEQPRNRDPVLLTVEGGYAAFREMGKDYYGASSVVYALSCGDEVQLLEDVQWADWSRSGELLIATSQGVLKQVVVNSLSDQQVVFEEDRVVLTPDPQEPPGLARRW